MNNKTVGIVLVVAGAYFLFVRSGVGVVPALGLILLVAGYNTWYTLYQKVWGDGSGWLFNFTGSDRFNASGSGGGSSDNAGGGNGKPDTTHGDVTGIRLIK